MPGTTPIYGLRYQELTDPPHGPNLGADLAADVEVELDRIDTAVTGHETRVTALETSSADHETRLDTLETRFDHGTEVIAINGSSVATIAHNLGVVPESVNLTPASHFGDPIWLAWDKGASTATLIHVEVRTDMNGGTVPNASRTVSWQAWA